MVSYPRLGEAQMNFNKAIIVPNDNLSSVRRNAVIWTNADVFLMGTFGTNFNEILIKRISCKINETVFEYILCKVQRVYPHGILNDMVTRSCHQVCKDKFKVDG